VRLSRITGQGVRDDAVRPDLRVVANLDGAFGCDKRSEINAYIIANMDLASVACSKLNGSEGRRGVEIMPDYDLAIVLDHRPAHSSCACTHTCARLEVSGGSNHCRDVAEGFADFLRERDISIAREARPNPSEHAHFL
jgi:hypothetical protein